jgi:hypothetical protein
MPMAFIKNSHLSLSNLHWFRFENVQVFCFRQNKIENRFFIVLYSFTLLFLGYGLKILKLPMHRPFIFYVGHLIKV